MQEPALRRMVLGGVGSFSYVLAREQITLPSTVECRVSIWVRRVGFHVRGCTRWGCH